MIDLKDEGIFVAFFRQELQYGIISDDFTDLQIFARGALSERKYPSAVTLSLAGNADVQPRQRHPANLLMDSQQTAVAGTNGQGLNCDERRKIFALPVQELDILRDT